MKSHQQFFAELKRRHVFKVKTIYGATAFVLLQLADLLIEALKLPEDFLHLASAAYFREHGRGIRRLRTGCESRALRSRPSGQPGHSQPRVPAVSRA